MRVALDRLPATPVGLGTRTKNAIVEPMKKKKAAPKKKAAKKKAAKKKAKKK